MCRKFIGLLSLGVFIALKALVFVLVSFVIIIAVTALFSAGALIQSSTRIVEYLTECQVEFLASIKEKR